MRLRSILLSVFALAFIANLNGQNRITVTLEEFTVLSVSGRADVEIVPSGSHDMSITSRNGQPEDVEYEIKNGKLKIKTKVDLKKGNEISIKVPYNQLTSIEAAGGAVINSRNDLKSDDLNLRALTGGKIEISIEAGMVDAKTTQGSDII
ncbi:GIN domain-containing protein, partial [Bacteroidota bacterium]